METWWSHYRSIADISVVHVDLTDNLIAETCALRFLDKTERQRAQRFVDVAPRRRFMLCRAALRATLCQTLHCENDDLNFRASDNGKPAAYCRHLRLPVEFNVSHSYTHGLIAVTRHAAVGIDVEARILRQDIDGEIRKVFSQREQRLLAQSPPQDKENLFFRLWTLKEALIKATGDGFRLDTSTFTLPDALIQGDLCSEFRFPHLPDRAWTVANLECDRFAAAVACEVASPNQ